MNTTQFSEGDEAGILYQLNGNACRPQVQPDAGYWALCPILHTPTIQEILAELKTLPPFYPAGSREERDEYELLLQLQDARFDPKKFDDNFKSGSFSVQTKLSEFLIDPRYTADPPPGSFFNARMPAHQPFLIYGAELAWLFAAEVPGYWHRHVLNAIAERRVKSAQCKREIRIREILSPPKKALVQLALEITIASALMAAWHFKWLYQPGKIARRRRPSEYTGGIGKLQVLYDQFPGHDENGNVIQGLPNQDIQPSPGTPRHPAYPSGHSTYSAAASKVLGCLFPTYKEEFKTLADNIGHARLWAGVHWPSDHLFGQKVGEAVGNLIIRQLNQSGIEPMGKPVITVPTEDELQEQAERFQQKCGNGTSDFCKGIIKLPEDKAFTELANDEGLQGAN